MRPYSWMRWLIRFMDWTPEIRFNLKRSADVAYRNANDLRLPLRRQMATGSDVSRNVET
jgi:hypothetical protein